MGTTDTPDLQAPPRDGSRPVHHELNDIETAKSAALADAAVLHRRQSAARDPQSAASPSQELSGVRPLPPNAAPLSTPASHPSGPIHMVAASITRFFRRHMAAKTPEQLLYRASNGQTTVLPSTSADIAAAVGDANLLLVYLTGIGEVPRPETVSGILNAKQALEDGLWTVQIGTSFLEAFAEISKQAKPITAKSLFESESWKPRRSVGLWSLLVIVLLPILVFLSALSFANGHFSDNVQKLIVLSYQAEEPDYVPPIPTNGNAEKTAQLPNVSQMSPDIGTVQSQSRIAAHEDALRAIILELQENTYKLVTITRSEGQINDLLKSSAFKDFQDSPNLTIQLRMWRAIGKVVTSYNDIIFGLVNTYILPLLCALLGAAAYGLRSLSEATLARTYRVSHTAYGRAILAVIVGFAVGFFSKFAATLSLEPLAAAFIAGYAVESFFIFLDTILQAVRKPKPA